MDVAVDGCRRRAFLAVDHEVPLAAPVVELLPHVATPGQFQVCIISTFLEGHRHQLSVVLPMVKDPGVGLPTDNSVGGCTLNGKDQKSKADNASPTNCFA